MEYARLEDHILFVFAGLGRCLVVFAPFRLRLMPLQREANASKRGLGAAEWQATKDDMISFAMICMRSGGSMRQSRLGAGRKGG